MKSEPAAAKKSKPPLDCLGLGYCSQSITSIIEKRPRPLSQPSLQVYSASEAVLATVSTL
ncbi:hypothetical protein BMI76_02320 [Streptococcus sp. 'caviae']|nr:hypothetical protein BMI76_02320 [Streptococcus sp. 'caviae']